MTLPILVRTAARPTTECNAATICGSSVAVMRRPMIAPTVPPILATAANCASISGGKPTAAREARMPEPTPRIPSVLPCRAVVCDARPDNEAGSKCRSDLKVPVRGRRRRTYTKDAASQVSSLDQTRRACVGSRQEPSGEYYGRYAVKPRILWRISRSYPIRLGQTTEIEKISYS